MKKSLKIFLIILISVVALAGLSVGAYFLFKDDGKTPEKSKYTETQKDFIDSINGSVGKVESEEQDVVLPANVSLSQVNDIYDGYIVATINGKQEIIKRANVPTIIEFEEEFDAVIAVSGCYALVKNSQVASSKPFVVNLETAKTVVSNLEYNSFFDNDSELTYSGYAFVGEYLVVSTGTDDEWFDYDNEFIVKVYNLKNGELQLNLQSGNDLANGDFVLKYSTNNKFLLIKTLNKSAVYDLSNANNAIIPQIVSFENEIYEPIGTSGDNDFDYILRSGTRYKIKTEFKLSVLSDNRIFVSKFVQPDLQEDASFWLERYNPVGDNLQRYFNQTCFVYDIANDAQIPFNTNGNYIFVGNSMLDGFALIISCPIYDENSFDAKGANLNAQTATYYQVATMNTVLTYNYSTYGDIIGSYDDKIICYNSSGSQVKTILKLDGQKAFDLPYRTTNKKTYDGYFVVYDGAKYGIYDINGNLVLDVLYSQISPVVAGHSIVISSSGRVYNFDVSTKTLVEISNFYDEFISYAMKGVEYYVTNANGKFQVYNIQGTLLVDNLDEVKIIDAPGGVKILFEEQENNIKAFISQNVEIVADRVVASVTYNYVPKYNTGNGVVFAGNEKNELISLNNASPVADADSQLFYYTVEQGKIINGVDYYNVIGNGNINNENNSFNISNYLADLFGKNVNIFNSNLIDDEDGVFELHTINQTIMVDESKNITINVNAKLTARFLFYKNTNYTWENREAWEEEYRENLLTEQNTNLNFSPKIEINISCSSGYYFAMGDLSAIEMYYWETTGTSGTGKEKRDVMLYVNTGYPSSTFNFSYEITDFAVFPNNLNEPEYFIDVGSVNLTIAPILYAKYNVKINQAGDTIIYEYNINSTIYSTSRGNVNALNGDISLIEIASLSGQYVLQTKNGVFFDGDSLVQTETLRPNRNKEIIIYEAYNDVYFKDVDSDGNTYDIVANALSSGNSGSDGRAVILDKDGNLLSSDELTAFIENIFKRSSDGEYFYTIYAGGTNGTGAYNNNGFATGYGSGLFGLVDNVKVAEFPFSFDKAGYSYDALNFEHISGAYAYFNPVFTANNSGKMVVQGYVGSAITITGQTKQIVEFADDPQGFSRYEVNPIYQVFYNPLDSGTKYVYVVDVDEEGNATGNSYIYNDWRHNNTTAANFVTVWEAKPFDMYFYAEQETLNGTDLVGTASGADRDWYFNDLDNDGEFTFSSLTFGDLTRNSEVIIGGAIGNARVEVMQSQNKVDFGAEILGLPIPVKYGYNFIGWQPMKVENGTLVEIEGAQLITESSVLLNAKNCDAWNEYGQLHFKAVFEEKEITLQINVGADSFFAENGFTVSANSDDWTEGCGGWTIRRDGNNVILERKLKFSDLNNFGKTTWEVPSPVGTRWQIVNYNLSLFNSNADAVNNSSTLGWVDLNYIPYELNDRGQLVQSNFKPGLARNFDLVQMLSQINATLKSDDYDYSVSGETRNYYLDSINGYTNSQNEFVNYLNNGFNIQSINLTATPIIVDYFVELNASGVSGAEILGQYAVIAGTFDISSAGSFPNNVAKVEAYSGVDFLGLACNSLDYRFNLLSIRLYVGDGTKSVDLNYNIVWKNNIYFGVNFTEYSLNGFGAQTLSGDEVASLIGLDSVQQLNNIVGFNDDFTKINVNLNQLKFGTQGETDKDIIKITNERNGNLEQIYIRSVELNFSVLETSYEIVMSAHDANEINLDESTISNIANMQAPANSTDDRNKNVFINIGAVEDQMVQPNISTTDGVNGKEGYAVTSVGRKNTKVLTLLSGGEFTDERSVYSHLVKNIVIADLQTIYNNGNFEYVVNGYLLVTIEFNISYSLAGQIQITATIKEGEEITAENVNLVDNDGTEITLSSGDRLTLQITSGTMGTFKLQASVQLLGSGSEEVTINNDKLVATVFAELKQGEFESNVYKDDVLDEGASVASENPFNAITSTTLSYNNFNGYYLKSLKITIPSGVSLEVLAGYPSFNTENGRIEYNYATFNLTSSSPYYLNNTLISLDNLPQTTQESSAQVSVILYGLYRNVKIEAYYESILTLFADNQIVNFDGNNLSELDFDVTLNYDNNSSESIKNLQFASYPENISNRELAKGNYYVFGTNESVTPNRYFVVFMLLGKNVNNVDVLVEDNYKNYEDISSINEVNLSSGTKVVNGIFAKNNLIKVVFNKLLNDLTINLDFGFTSDSGWQSYSALDYYERNDFENFNALLEKRLGNSLSISYFDALSNPTNNVPFVENGLYRNYALSCFNGTDLIIIYKPFAGYNSNAWLVDRFGNALDSNYYLIEDDGEGAKRITISGNYLTEDRTISLRFEANSYKLQYKPNKPLTSAEDDKVLYYANTELAENGDNAYIITVRFDGIVTPVNHITYPDDNLRLIGHDFVGWFTTSESSGGVELKQNETPLNENFINTDDDIAYVYARWTVKTIIVTFMPNDKSAGNGSTLASFSNAIQVSYLYNELYGDKMPVPTRNGYTLDGWSKTGGLIANQLTKVTSEDSVDENDNYILYARWKPNEYNVTYILPNSDIEGNLFANYGSVPEFADDPFIGADGVEIVGKTSTQITIKMLFDSTYPANPMPIATCKGFDFLMWAVNNDPNMPIGESTTLIWDHVIDGKVEITSRWQLQGVKVLLITQNNSSNTADNERLELLAHLWGSTSSSRPTLLEWLLKSKNGGDNGVINNFSAQTITENGKTITYNINIPYYSPAGTNLSAVNFGFKAPVADGFIFQGYYYYNGANFIKYIEEISDGECALTMRWELEWDKENPIKLYAGWVIKKFNVSFTIGDEFSNLFKGLGLSYDNYVGDNAVGYTLNSSLDLTIEVWTGHANNSQKIETHYINASSTSYSINLELEFYQQLKLNMTMAEGHYLSKVIVGDGTEFVGEWKNESKRTIGLDSFYSGAKQQGSLDNFVLRYDTYYGVNSNEPNNKKYKQDIVNSGINHIVTDYDIEFEFARQWFNVTIVQLRQNPGGSLTEFKRIIHVIPHNGVFSVEELGGLPFHSTDGNYYIDAACTTEYTGARRFIYDNMDLYCKYTSNSSTVHEGHFYGFGANGYERINTGSNYVYATIQNGEMFVNGDPNRGGYTWTDCLNGQTIAKFPIVTAFYWPNEIDGTITGFQFAYWVRFKEGVSVDTQTPLTPFILLTKYKDSYDIIELGTTMNSGDIYYAVFDSYDKTVPEFSAEGDGDGTSDDYYLSKDYGKYSTLKLKLGASKIDVSSARLAIRFNGQTHYIYNIETDGYLTENVSYEMKIMDFIQAYGFTDAFEVRFEITSSLGNEFYTEWVLISTIVSNVTEYNKSYVTGFGDGVTPMGGYAYYLVDGKYYFSVDISLEFKVGNGKETVAIGVPSIYLGGTSTPTEKTISVGNKTFKVTATATATNADGIWDEMNGGYYWVFTINVTVV